MKSFLYTQTKDNVEMILQIYDVFEIQALSDTLTSFEYDALDQQAFINNLTQELAMNASMISMHPQIVVSQASLNDFLLKKKYGCYRLEDYLFYCLIFFKQDVYVDKLIQYVLALDNELRQMLIVFVNENGNVLKSSKLLYLHRNTMLYRLQKISDVLKLDLNHPKVIYSLAIIFEMFAL